MPSPAICGPKHAPPALYRSASKRAPESAFDAASQLLNFRVWGSTAARRTSQGKDRCKRTKMGSLKSDAALG